MMETNYPQDLQYAIAKRNGAQAILERGIVQSRRKVLKAKQMCGVQADPEPVHIMVTYYLLRPQEPKTYPESLMARDMVAVHKRDVWIEGQANRQVLRRPAQGQVVFEKDACKGI